MLILVRIIGVIITVMGIIILLSPKIMKQLIAFFEQGKRLYLAGVLRILFGIVFLLVATQCRLVGVIVVLGILFLIGGILIFTLGLEKSKSILKWWERKSPLVFRLVSLIPIFIGVLILYSI